MNLMGVVPLLMQKFSNDFICWEVNLKVTFLNLTCLRFLDFLRGIASGLAAKVVQKNQLPLIVIG